MIVEFDKSLRGEQPDRYIGMEWEMARLTGAVAENIGGRCVPIAVAGAPGVGKSELLRQSLIQLVHRGADVIPLYFNLLKYSNLVTLVEGRAEAEVWSQLIRSLVRQLIAFDRELSLLEPPLLGATPSLLAQLCYSSGLGAWAPVIQNGVTKNDLQSGIESWQGIIRSRLRGEGPRPVIVIDGTGRSSEPELIRRLGQTAIRSLLGEGVPLSFEADLREVRSWPEAGDVDVIELSGLNPEQSLRLIECCCTGMSDAPPGTIAEAVVQRLGGYPKLIRAWVSMWTKLPRTLTPARRGWEAYLNVLARSAPAERWGRRFDKTVPINLRPRLLDLLASLSERAETMASGAISTSEAVGRAGLNPADADAIFEGLVTERLIRRRGEGFVASDVPAIRDWAVLRSARREAGDGDGGKARAEMLRRLLRTGQADAGESRDRIVVDKLLSSFSLQHVPEALFLYDQYFEALGQFSPARRRVEIAQSTRRIRLPEVIGVIGAESLHDPGRPALGTRDGGGRGRLPVSFAYAYRDATYQRSHEETWIVTDCSHLGTLTSAEVRTFLEEARRVERHLGPGRYTRWIVAGESISAEAIELIVSERIYCSGTEQMLILVDLVRSAESSPAAGETSAEAKPAQKPARPSESEAPAEGVAKEGGASSEPSSPKAPVITIQDFSGEVPKISLGRLCLKAGFENEVVAGLAAERIAIQRGFDSDEAGQIKMAVLEGALNAIEHSTNSEKEISVEFIDRPADLEIVIENDGAHFDPLAVEDPDPKKKLKAENKRGWGIKLMHEFMDGVVYEPTGHGTRLRLRKTRRDVQEDSSMNAWPDQPSAH